MSPDVQAARGWQCSASAEPSQVRANPGCGARAYGCHLIWERAREWVGPYRLWACAKAV